MTEQTATDERGLLDTSVVITAGVTPIPGVLAISAVTLAELHFGVLVLPGLLRCAPNACGD